MIRVVVFEGENAEQVQREVNNFLEHTPKITEVKAMTQSDSMAIGHSTIFRHLTLTLLLETK